MPEIGLIILKIWTVITAVSVSILFTNLKTKEAMHFYTGCIFIGWVSGAVFGSSLAWYMNTYYPIEIPVEEEIENYIDKILDSEVNETNSKNNIEEEELKKARRNKFKWLAIGYIICYFLVQL